MFNGSARRLMSPDWRLKRNYSLWLRFCGGDVAFNVALSSRHIVMSFSGSSRHNNRNIVLCILFTAHTDTQTRRHTRAHAPRERMSVVVTYYSKFSNTVIQRMRNRVCQIITRVSARKVATLDSVSVPVPYYTQLKHREREREGGERERERETLAVIYYSKDM